MKYIGTVARGIKTKIINRGDDIVKMVVDSIENCISEANIKLNDKDVVAITEAVVARAQGNYATIDQIASDVSSKFERGAVGLLFPIMSRNRFSLLLKAIAKGVDKLIIQLSYPSDEVGNPLVALDALLKEKINPYSDILTYDEFRKFFPTTIHPFTRIDYLEYYKKLGNCEIIIANDPTALLKYTDQILVASIHSRHLHKQILKDKGAKNVCGLDDILTSPVNGSGYHEEYGLLGSNLATDVSVKLFPRDNQNIVNQIKQQLSYKYHKEVEVMVYGDGAFKDPIGGIWELADPVVSPGFTDGLLGTPNELKLKFLADNTLKDLKGQEAEEAMKELIKEKKTPNPNDSLGTTPRRIVDLLGSLADLMSGSGDKGTPIILIQNYFNNYSDD